MESEKIKLKTEAGQAIEAVVLSKHADRIDVVIAESVRCYSAGNPAAAFSEGQFPCV